MLPPYKNVDLGPLYFHFALVLFQKLSTTGLVTPFTSFILPSPFVLFDLQTSRNSVGLMRARSQVHIPEEELPCRTRRHVLSLSTHTYARAHARVSRGVPIKNSVKFVSFRFTAKTTVDSHTRAYSSAFSTTTRQHRVVYVCATIIVQTKCYNLNDGKSPE